MNERETEVARGEGGGGKRWVMNGVRRMSERGGREERA